MKRHVRLVQSVTIFMVLIFLRPIFVNACLPNPTNYWSQPVPVSNANIVPVVDERQPAPQPEEHKLIAPVIFFIIILAVAAYIIYQLVKLLDKVIPPPDKKPDPPPNSGNTNYPPIVINPTHGPGPVLVAAKTKSLTITSNTPSWGTITNYDISALQYRDQAENFPAPVYYDRFWSTGMKTTTDMVNWRDTHYRIDCYIASTAGAVYYAYYHYGTNWWNCYYTTDYIASNHIAPAWFDLSDEPPQPNQFFRIDPK